MKKIFLLILPIFFIFSSNVGALEKRACTTDYTPVCGVDGVTYSNTCTANKVKVAYTGECKIKPCTKSYVPVCGLVQIECIKAPCNPIFETFTNKCELNKIKSAKLAYKGECKEKILGPSKIKYYKNITKYGNDIFGNKKTDIEIQNTIYNIIKNSKSECVIGGQKTFNKVVNKGDDFLRFEGSTTKKGCGFACIYKLDTNTIESGWMCTGLIIK